MVDPMMVGRWGEDSLRKGNGSGRRGLSCGASRELGIGVR